VRAHALEGLVGRSVPALFVCTANARAETPDLEGGERVRELYTSHWAVDRYRYLSIYVFVCVP